MLLQLKARKAFLKRPQKRGIILQIRKLPEWILAINKVLYQGSWSNQYDVFWDDQVIEKDGSQRFTDMELKVADLSTKWSRYTLKIAFDTASISVQGTHYLEFIQEVFPDIKSLVKSNHVGKSPQKPQGRQPGDNSKATEEASFSIAEKISRSTSNTWYTAPLPAAQSEPEEKTQLQEMSRDIAHLKIYLEQMDLKNLLQAILTNQKILERKLGIIESKVIQQDKSTDLKGMTSVIDESKEALNIHMKQLSETFKQEIKENFNQGSEVSLLVEEMSNKNNHIEKRFTKENQRSS